MSKTPYDQGFDARIVGRWLADCPYTEGSRERREWIDGWRKCKLVEQGYGYDRPNLAVDSKWRNP